MNSAKETVRQNLVKLRKEHKLTQLELAKEIGYSDKAVSRWETGEVTPDIDTLEALAALYAVPISLFFEEYNPKKVRSYDLRRLHIGKKFAISIMVAMVIWYFAVMAFMYRQIKEVPRPWMAFIAAIPVTFIAFAYFSKRWGRYRVVTYVFASCAAWTSILALYLHFLDMNMYMLFPSCVPIQICIILWYLIRYPKDKKEE